MQKTLFIVMSLTLGLQIVGMNPGMRLFVATHYTEAQRGNHASIKELEMQELTHYTSRKKETPRQEKKRLKKEKNIERTLLISQNQVTGPVNDTVLRPWQ